MKIDILKRREFLRLGLLAGLYGLAGCSRDQRNPILIATQETLPKEWLSTLPPPWIFKELEREPEFDLTKVIRNQNIDLLAIGDGWISEFLSDELQPLGAEEMVLRLNGQAKDFLKALLKIKLVFLELYPK